MDDAVLPWLYLFILHSTSTAKHHCAVTRFGLVSARVGISRSGDNCISLGQISASPLISLQFNLCLWTSCTHWTENRLKAKPKTEQTLALCGVIVEGGWRRQRTALQPESCDHCQSNHFTWEGGDCTGSRTPCTAIACTPKSTLFLIQLFKQCFFIAYLGIGTWGNVTGREITKCRL